jgi:hypothetical protein
MFAPEEKQAEVYAKMQDAVSKVDEQTDSGLKQAYTIAMEQFQPGKLLEFWIYVHNSRLHFGAILQFYGISSTLVFTYSSRVCTLQVLYLTRYTLCFPVPNLLSEHVPELLTIIQHKPGKPGCKFISFPGFLGGPSEHVFRPHLGGR